MKLKNILNRNFDSLTNDEKKFYDDVQEKYLLGVCDKYNIVTDELGYLNMILSFYPRED